jgi:hypothetical protein
LTLAEAQWSWPCLGSFILCRASCPSICPALLKLKSWVSSLSHCSFKSSHSRMSKRVNPTL